MEAVYQFFNSSLIPPRLVNKLPNLAEKMMGDMLKIRIRLIDLAVVLVLIGFGAWFFHGGILVKIHNSDPTTLKQVVIRMGHSPNFRSYPVGDIQANETRKCWIQSDRPCILDYALSEGVRTQIEVNIYIMRGDKGAIDLDVSTNCVTISKQVLDYAPWCFW